jgi:hypothetical protein
MWYLIGVDETKTNLKNKETSEMATTNLDAKNLFNQDWTREQKEELRVALAKDWCARQKAKFEAAEEAATAK